MRGICASSRSDRGAERQLRLQRRRTLSPPFRDSITTGIAALRFASRALDRRPRIPVRPPCPGAWRDLRSPGPRASRAGHRRRRRGDGPGHAALPRLRGAREGWCQHLLHLPAVRDDTLQARVGDARRPRPGGATGAGRPESHVTLAPAAGPARRPLAGPARRPRVGELDGCAGDGDLLARRPRGRLRDRPAGDARGPGARRGPLPSPAPQERIVEPASVAEGGSSPDRGAARPRGSRGPFAAARRPQHRHLLLL